MSTETLTTLAEQYKYQIEALQNENKRLTKQLDEAKDLLREVMEIMQ